MADRSVLFRLSNGAFQDVATGDNLLAAGVKRAGTVTIDATAGNVVLQGSGDVNLNPTGNTNVNGVDINLTATDDVVVSATDGASVSAGNILLTATVSNITANAAGNVNLNGVDVVLTGTDDVSLVAADLLSLLSSGGDITIDAADDILLTAVDGALMTAGNISLAALISTITLDAATKVIFDSPNASAYDAANERWGFGNPSPSVQWDFFSASPSATQGHLAVRTSTGTMFEVDLQNGLVTVGSSLVPAQLRTWATITLAALRVGSVAGDPSTLADGDIWYDSTNGKFRAREAGVSVDMIGGGGGVSEADVWRLSMLHQVAG